MDNHELAHGLARELQSLEDRKTNIAEAVQELLTELSGVDKRIGLIRALLNDGKHDASAPTSITSSPPSTPGRLTDPLDVAYAILEERGGDVIHYKELAELVLERGGELGGSDAAQTLVSKMVRDPRFTRPIRRGWYTLTMFYPNSRNVGERRRRARRHKS